MNKMISFRDLIDLEPKPKKVKYLRNIYEFDGDDYKNIFEHLEDIMPFRYMKEPNIEIIEEDKHLIEKLEPSKDNEYYYTNDNRYNELVDEVLVELFPLLFPLLFEFSEEDTFAKGSLLPVLY